MHEGTADQPVVVVAWRLRQAAGRWAAGARLFAGFAEGAGEMGSKLCDFRLGCYAGGGVLCELGFGCFAGGGFIGE